MLGFRPVGYRGPAMLETRQLHPTLAREVVGLSLWEKLDDTTVAELRDLYAQYGVLVFRRQALSEAGLRPLRRWDRRASAA
jgi:alpha-ketoglutarate-dependent taurine dioxygenase